MYSLVYNYPIFEQCDPSNVQPEEQLTAFFQGYKIWVDIMFRLFNCFIFKYKVSVIYKLRNTWTIAYNRYWLWIAVGIVSTTLTLVTIHSSSSALHSLSSLEIALFVSIQFEITLNIKVAQNKYSVWRKLINIIIQRSISSIINPG